MFLVYLGLIAVLVYFYFKRKYSYWEERGVPSLKGKFPFGNVSGMGTKLHTSELFKRIYDENKGNGNKGVALYVVVQPAFLITEPDLVKEVLVRGFESFHDRGIYYNEKHDPLSENLFFLKGQRWRDLRAKLSPTFTSGKIKMMFETVSKISDGMIDYIKPFVEKGEAIEIKEVLTSYGTEVITSCAFGVETKVLGDPNNDFRKVANMIFNPPKWFILKFLFMGSFQKLSKKLGLRAHLKEMTEFFTGVIKSTLEYREKNNVVRNDFLQLLIEIKNSEAGMSFNEIAANSFIFFLGGFESSASVASFTMYELALNQDIQDRLRQEIEETVEKQGGDVSYDAILEMKYLDMVFNESLRRYPVIDTQVRKCTKDFNIPDSNIVIPADTLIVISSNALHNDERFFENPTVFDPERFNEENIKNQTPYSYIPFSGGPRICIGQRFGTLQTKLAIVKLLRNYRFSPCEKTPIPMKFSPSSAFQAPIDGMWLKIEKLDD